MISVPAPRTRTPVRLTRQTKALRKALYDFMTGKLITEMAGGDLDFIGDVHGEIDSLRALLDTLGYSLDGNHPKGRRLVFVGDLVDRGPDSVGVVDLISNLVSVGRAQCVLGNHELNLLRQERKPNNEWFFDRINASSRSAIVSFFKPLPLALERRGLRTVHACWHQPAVDCVRRHAGDALSLYRLFDRKSQQTLALEGVTQAADQQQRAWVLTDSTQTPPMLDAVAQFQARKQMDNPVAIMTSGIETVAAEPFWAKGKWRFTARVPWWEDYAQQDDVVIGHYWRSRTGGHQFTRGPGLFDNASTLGGLGPQERVMCIDYSIGQRAKERRLNPKGPFKSALAAFRITDQKPSEVIFSPV
ncbi:MAG: metallophosphoesterase [Pseudomonadota bacterium]